MVLKDCETFSLAAAETGYVSEQARKYSRLFHAGEKMKYATIPLSVLFLYLCFLVCDNKLIW